LQRVIECRHS